MVDKEKDLFQRIKDTTAAIRKKSQSKPTTAIILGTGLGGLVKEIEIKSEIPYSELPHFPLSTVEAHEGKLILGALSGVEVVAFQGRFHRYEGYDMVQVSYPVRIAKELGCRNLIISNAAGGISSRLSAGDLVVIDDHINLQSENSLVGSNDDRLGPRFVDLFECYDPGFVLLAKQASRSLGQSLVSGVYASVVGPHLETAAEYRALQILGADMVGMSTVPEVLVARHSGMKVLGLSVITDECHPGRVGAVDIQKILKTAYEAEPRLTALIKKVISKI